VLARDLGEWGIAAARLARGEDRREVEPYREAKSYGEENTFEGDIGDRGELEKVIRAHAEAVARRLRRDGVRGRGVTVKLKLARGLGAGKYPVITRSATLQAPTDDGAEIARVGRSLLARAQLREPVRLLGVSVSRIESPVGSQLPLLEEKGQDPEARSRLNRVTDAIRDRFGDRSLSSGPGTVERAGLSLQIKRGEEGDGT
jgi:DNA polymerase-4